MPTADWPRRHFTRRASAWDPYAKQPWRPRLSSAGLPQLGSPAPEFKVAEAGALPPNAGHGEPDAGGGARDTAGFASSSLTVLVVDDNVDAAEAMSLMLEIHGFTLHVAHGAAEAMALAERVRPHVALLDIGLPDMPGDELGRVLRQQPWGRSMVIAAVTGWGQSEVRLRTTQAGFDAHFTKPVDSGELVKWIAGASVPTP